MKSFTLLFGLALVAVASAEFTEEQKAKALEHIRICRAETGFTEEALRKLKSGDVSDNSKEAKVIIPNGWPLYSTTIVHFNFSNKYFFPFRVLPNAF